MRLFYSIVVIFFIIIVLLFVGSFFYFAEVVHNSMHFSILSEGKNLGIVSVDRYNTEENIVIKSKKSSSEENTLPVSSLKYVMSKKKKNSFEIEKSENLLGYKNNVVIRKNGEEIGFLSKKGSKFSVYNDSISLDVLYPYSRYEIATWLPLLDKYDLKVGGQQMFNVIVFNNMLLPPYRMKIFISHDKGEYLSIGNKKIRTEKIILKQEDNGNIFIWYVPKEHRIYKVEYEKEDITLEDISSKDLAKDDRGLISETSEKGISDIKEIIFFSQNQKINGFLSRPKKEGEFPAVIFLQKESDPSQDYHGLFSSLADHLTLQGYVCLWMQLKGKTIVPGCSGLSLSDEYKHISRAIDLLQEYRFVSVDKIFILSHGEPFSILPGYLKNEKRIKGWIAMSVNREDPIFDLDLKYAQNILSKRDKIDQGYSKRISKYREQTLDIVNNDPGQWKRSMGKSVFLTRMRDLMDLKISEDILAIDIPVYVISGKEDMYSSQLFREEIKRVSEENAFIDFETFSGLGYFLSKEELPGQDLFSVDQRVLKSISSWLDSVSLQLQKAKIEKEKAEQARIEQLRIEQEKAEQARIEQLRMEQEKVEQARIAQLRIEQEKAAPDYQQQSGAEHILINAPANEKEAGSASQTVETEVLEHE